MQPGATGKVLIAGAGPTGLMAACELARRDIDCTVIDKAAQPSDKSRALGVHARTLEMLDDLGIAEAMIQDGLVVRRMKVFADRKPLAEVNFDDLESPFPFTLALPQDKTEKHLTKCLASSGRQILRQHELVDVKTSADKVDVKIKTADGKEISQTYDWLIACDGAHSTVRHALQLPFEGGTYEEQFVLADVRLELPPELTKDSQWQPFSIHMTKAGLLAFFQIGGDRYRVIAVLPPDTVLSKGTEPTLLEVQAMVDERAPKGIRLHDPVWLASFRINYRQLRDYRHGRVLFAGDAAHVHSPAGGQGMNTGMQDAVNLAWKLALVIKEGAGDSLLNSYAIERHAVAAAVLKGTDFLTRVNIMRNPLGRELRNRLAPILIGQEVIQAKITRNVSELAVAYRSSPIVFEHKRSLLAVAAKPANAPDQPGWADWFEFGHGPSPGERAPDAHAVDARTDKPIRLFQAMRGIKHSLLLLAGEHESEKVLAQIAPLAHAVEQMFGRLVQVVIVAAEGSGLAAAGTNTECDFTPPEILRKLEASVLYDPDLSVHHKYGAGSACAYLIRPDGYVGYRGQPPELIDIERYFKLLLGGEVD